MQVINVYKPIGKTPFQVVQQFKKIHPEFQNTKIGYAGRLDPMAEGVLILLIGDTNKEKKDFEGLEKKYEFESIFGFETDSYDLLGKVNLEKNDYKTIKKKDILDTLDSFRGEITQSYPPFSSVRVNGKPLLYWAFHNKLNEITIPQKKVIINDITLNDLKTISSEDLYKNIIERVNSVMGNFRQQEILNQWRIFFETNTKKHFQCMKASLYCSSGTYVRSFVNEFAKKLHITATTASIKRLAVGDFTLKESVNLFKVNRE